MEPTWRIRVDTGGTFTDVWVRTPEGEERRLKILSDGTVRLRLAAREGGGWRTDGEMAIPEGALTGWRTESGARVEASGERGRWIRLEGDEGACGETVGLSCGEEAPVAAAMLLTGTAAGGTLPAVDLRVATTRGTNALLEKKTAKVGLVTNAGLEDVPELGDQRRPNLFDPRAGLPGSGAAWVAGVRGRIDARGRVIEELDEGALREVLRKWKSEGCEVLAVAFPHSWLNPVFEERAGEVAGEEGFRHVTLSHRAAPLIRLLPRMQTAVTDAALGPVMDHFTSRILHALGGRGAWMMTSAGGLVEMKDFRPKDALLSGPAGGLVGAVEWARGAGYERVLTFDMGGTSTDVARVDGEYRWKYEQEIGGAKVLAPSMRIETVAAGGGSICRWHQGRLEVGPESAGADPGPACYGRGGPLTLTDVNLLGGWMTEEGAGIPLDRGAAEARLEELMEAMRRDGEEAADRDGLLKGLRDLAVETMAESIRGITVREGADPADYVMVAFGGAGPQHACAVAERLGIRTILAPGNAGLLSAWGLERARRQKIEVKQVLRPLEEAWDDLEGEWDELFERVRGGGETKGWGLRRLADLRLAGQDTAVEIELPEGEEPGLEEWMERFRESYERLYGYAPPEMRVVELVVLRVAAEEARGEEEREAFEEDAEAGPRVKQDRFSTCVVGEGWSWRKGSRGSFLLEDLVGGERRTGASGAVRAGLYRSRFEGLVGAMGEVLKRTALSTNVKERLDYSCALMDAGGRLVASAPHVPVHLGALGVCVREVAKVIGMGPGDVVVTNHPGFGGSHLPDVTLIAPVYAEDGSGLLGYVANRAHHAEIGGMAPGSMPAGAKCLEEEGVVIEPMKLVEGGVVRWAGVEAKLAGGRWPTRRLPDQLADLEAQMAACRLGVEGLKGLARRDGSGVVRQELAGILERSAQLMRERWLEMEERAVEVTSRLDDGWPIRLRLEFGGGRLKLSTAGSGPVHPANLNATPAIVRSVLLYGLRVWLGEDVPLNEGLLEDVEIDLPEGFLNPEFAGDPAACPAVVGGNVEVSQRLADLWFEAVGMMANGAGTMNNFLFGNERFGYYETLAGGAGAGEGWDGMPARQVHMTNTAITDVEVLEHRYPVRVRKHARRRGSGGHGRWRGGDGIVREIEFLEPLQVSFLTQRRSEGPKGMQGGGEGAAGRQTRIFADGHEERLPWAITYLAEAGESVRIETPGGGGWGEES